MHRRPDNSGGDLAVAVAKVQKELVTSVTGITPIESADVTFADGTTGVLLAYAMPAPRGLEICQFQGLRLDGGTLTTLTISTGKDQLTPELKEAYVKAIAFSSLFFGSSPCM
ncbi:MAG: hypothetical protein ACYTFT_16010 [Planctomycetota bacterium]